MKTKINLLIAVLILFIGCTSDDNNNSNQINDLSSIQGDWYRVGGNNPDNNGMKVNVLNDQGTIEEPALSNFQVDDIKWADILQSANDENVFTYQELGSNYNYFDATMELGVDDTLRISVANSGVGNIQKWVRTFIDTMEPEEHDCSTYNAEGSNNAIGDDWEAPNETDFYGAFVPSTGQPGGGIYTVTLSNGDGVVPGLKVTSSNDSSGAISNGTAAGTDNETVRTTSFIAHPGVSYDVDAHYSSYVIVDNPPITYNLSYSFSGKMDCYEPNDVISESKRIPKNQVIEAYALTGYINNSVVTNEPQNFDYYKVRLETTAKLKVELLQVPSSVNLGIAILNLDESGIGASREEISGTVSEDGAIYNTTTNSALPSGNYVVRVYIGGTKKTVINDGEATPEHWNMPYKFKVTAIQ